MEWVNAIVQGILLGGLYALFAAGLSIIFGVMKLVNIAHGDFIVVAAYFAFFVMQILGISPFTSLVIVVPIAALFGYLLQRVLLNWTLGGDELPPLLVTFGLSVIIQNLLLVWFTPDTHRLQAGAVEIMSWNVNREVSVGVLPFIQFIAAVALIAALQLLFYRTAVGRAFRATSDDQDVAQLMGLENRHIFGLAMALSFAVIAFAGVFIGIRTNFDPFRGPQLLIFGFEAIIIGGLGNLWGTLAGGILLGIAQSIGGHIDLQWQVLSGHIALLIVLLVRPEGLFPKVT